MIKWQQNGQYYRLELATVLLVVHPYERNNPDKQGMWISEVKVADRTDRGDVDGLHSSEAEAKRSALERARGILHRDLSDVDTLIAEALAQQPR